MVAADSARLRRTLGDPALARLVRRLARRLELDRPLDADLTLEAATEAERLALGRLLGRRVSLHGRSLRVSPASLAAALSRAGIAPDLRTAVELLTGPVTSRSDVVAAEGAKRDAALSVIAGSRHAGTAWYDQWAESLQADGTLTRLVRAGTVQLVWQAADVLSLLPADALPLPVLAEQATGDTKALASTPLARLVLRALALREGVTLPTLSRREAQRALWESAGVIPDDLASQVLVLGVTASPSRPLGRWLSEAAAIGTPMRITLHQLVSMPIEPTVAELFVCENPSVLRAAVAGQLPVPVSGPSAQADGASSGFALVCTEGVPSAACHRLLSACVRAGAVIRWRGDFDWTGVRTVAAAIARYGALPWRMGLAAYEEALAAGCTEPLKGPAAESPWDPPLAARMAQSGRAVMEERLIPALLRDLGAASMTEGVPGSARPATLSHPEGVRSDY